MSPEELIIYSRGPIYCSICTNIRDVNRIKEVVNQQMPTLSEWKISLQKFRMGESNPCVCELKPKTHKHYLLEC